MYRKRVSAHLTCLWEGGGIAITLSYTCQNYIVFSTIAFKIARQALVRSHSWSKIEIIEVRTTEFLEKSGVRCNLFILWFARNYSGTSSLDSGYKVWFFHKMTIQTLRPFLSLLIPYEVHKFTFQCLFPYATYILWNAKMFENSTRKVFEMSLQRLKWLVTIFFSSSFCMFFLAD
jgi:hypothetical protein